MERMDRMVKITIFSILGSLACVGLSIYDQNWMATFAWIAATAAYYELYRCWKLVEEITGEDDEE
jgi:hypothetical protein